MHTARRPLKQCHSSQLESGLEKVRRNPGPSAQTYPLQIADLNPRFGGQKKALVSLDKQSRRGF